MTRTNRLVLGATRKGKSLSTARSILEDTAQAAIIFDPHKDSLAQVILALATGNVLFERLSDVRHTIGFEMLTPSSLSDPVQRRMENHQKSEAFIEILVRRRDRDGLAASPLMEEWGMAAIMLYLYQADAQ